MWRWGIVACAAGWVLAGCGGGGGGGGAVPQVTVAIGDPVALGSSPIDRLAFPVILSGPASGELVVTYSTADVAAVGGAACNAVPAPDYVRANNASVTIPSGASSGTIVIAVCNPAAFVGDAALRVNLVALSANGRFASEAARVAYGLVRSPLAVARGLNDTGVAQCAGWNARGACPANGFAGQDGEHGRDAGALTNNDADGHKGFSFAKVDANAGGNAQVLSAGSPAWECVQDNVTGLLWEAKTVANKDAVVTYADALAHAATLNAARHCGHDDWRLPTPQELAGLVNASVSRSVSMLPAIDQTFFAEQQAGPYWTDSEVQGNATEAWVVEFQYGLTTHYAKTSSRAVRLVRGTPVTPQFQAPVDGSVKDATTGLTWRVCADGLSGADCMTGSAATYDWQAALNRVAQINQAGLGGHRDWRLPNRNELASIIDYGRRNPALDDGVFPGFPKAGNGNALSCWTSTPYAEQDGVSGKAWAVDFLGGHLANPDMTVPLCLLLVRG